MNPLPAQGLEPSQDQIMRDTEEQLFERGGIVSYETMRRWCDKFGAGLLPGSMRHAASPVARGASTRCS